MYYTVYKTTNLLNGRIYIGAHQTLEPDDDYLGSGVMLKQAIKKYGRQNFKKEVLFIFDNPIEMMNEERKLVDEAFVMRKDTYNYEIGGKGGKVWTPELRKKLSAAAQGRVPWNKGKQVGSFMTEEAKIALGQRMTGANNHMHGVNVASLISPEKDAARRAKISKANQGVPKPKTDAYKRYAALRFWIVDKNGKLCHAVSENDPRLLSGEFIRGRKWK